MVRPLPRSETGPLRAGNEPPQDKAGPANAGDEGGGVGLDPTLFGRHPQGLAVEAGDLCMQSPGVIAVTIPADLAEGAEFVTEATLHPETAAEASVQVEVRADASSSLPAGGLVPAVPVVARKDSTAWRRFERAFADVRDLFPRAVCYGRIVPVDEVVTLNLYYREDDHLRRLMLDDDEIGFASTIYRGADVVGSDYGTACEADVGIARGRAGRRIVRNMAQTRAERRVLDKVLGISAHDSDEPAVVDARRSAPAPSSSRRRLPASEVSDAEARWQAAAAPVEPEVIEAQVEPEPEPEFRPETLPPVVGENGDIFPDFGGAS
ncbi:MAG: hypothetical protein EBY61_07085 [Actinobacteria bacterium]|nr:hypothetical protein [Actinomycetota bacterium]